MLRNGKPRLFGALALALLGPPSALASDSLSAMTFNIRYDNPDDAAAGNGWAARLVAVTALVEELKPDILGLQEVLPNQVEDLRGALRDYTLVSRARDADGGGEACTIAFRTERFTLELGTDRTWWLSETPNVAGSRSWESACPRIVQEAVLRESDGARVAIFNTHFDHRSAAARGHSGQLLGARLADFTTANPGVPLLITGDFNMEPTARPFIALLAGPPCLADAWATCRSADAPNGTFHDWTGQTDGRQIDAILAGAGLTPTAARIIRDRPEDRLPSDHWPVWASFRRAPAPLPKG